MPRYPVFFVERVDYLVRVNADCACGQRLSHSLGRRQELPDIPAAWPGAPCACGQVPRCTSVSGASVYRRPDTGEEVNADGSKLPIGAVYEDDWCEGPDGRGLCAVTPGGHWHIDSRASNCTRKDDHVHRCWVRHGRPEDGTLHVDKAGDTCAAGAGSIVMGSYHGFLHHGALVDC